MKILRPKKVKGFTLVELIVVMAIIGVLAAVLVPSMLGFMKDSKISQANQNANTVYTAAQAWLTKYTVANGTADVAGATLTVTNSTTAGSLEKDSTKTAVDMSSYLGDSFSGYYMFKVSDSGDTVEYAQWAKNEFTAWAKADMTPAKQDLVSDGNYVGCKPLKD